MATLQKFKLLATQCAVAGSPTRTASPVIHLRPRKTLRMFLSRTDRCQFTSRSNSDAPEMTGDGDDDGGDDRQQKNKDVARVRHKLKDLFDSSSPFEDSVSDSRSREIEQEEERRLLSATGSVDVDGSGGFPSRRGAGLSLRPLAASFRCRLLKRAWRPVLVTIPE